MVRRFRTLGRGRRWRRWALTAIAYSIGTIAVNVLMLGSVVAARATGHDERADVPDLQIKNLREVDDRLLAGAQPTGDAFERLAARGVTTVVDPRTRVVGEPTLDDPDELAALGMEYVPLPLHDGHAPDAELIESFLAVMEESDGRVFVHCGGGVGRSTTVEMAYRAAVGLDEGVLAQLAIGPPTIEQVFFVSSSRWIDRTVSADS